MTLTLLTAVTWAYRIFKDLISLRNCGLGETATLTIQRPREVTLSLSKPGSCRAHRQTKTKNEWKPMVESQWTSGKEDHLKLHFWLPTIDWFIGCVGWCTIFWVAFLLFLFDVGTRLCLNYQGSALSWITGTTQLVVCILTFWSEIRVSLTGGVCISVISGFDLQCVNTVRNLIGLRAWNKPGLQTS